jgi:IgA peptidase M64/peptidase M64-like protein
VRPEVNVLALVLALAAAVPATLRLDYVHSGNAGAERFALDGLVREGPWPGRPDRPLDDTNLGKYYFEVRDPGTNRVLYTRGFASVYGEWETTPEAKDVERAFHESLRFPAPDAPVQVTVRKRDRHNLFREVWTVRVDPADPALDRAAAADAKAWAVFENGPPADKVDLLLLGDGYTAAEMGKWHADAKRLAETLFAVSPFKERRSDFNVWALDTPAAESGVARPSDGVYRRSPLRAAYDAFGSERYVLTFDNKRLREAAAAAPYDFIEIVVNDRKYGGGGIHNLYATVSADNAFTPYVFVHEFGHHFAGLADEYYTSSVAYETGGDRVEPWEPNVTADPKAARWADLVTAGTPLPTPWSKDEFEAAQREVQARRRQIRAEKRPEAEMEALFREERERTTKLLASGPHGRAVGAFEGALYEAKGYYRPQADCIMFTRDEVGFCAVCRRAIERVIDLYARRAPGAR